MQDQGLFIQNFWSLVLRGAFFPHQNTLNPHIPDHEPVIIPETRSLTLKRRRRTQALAEMRLEVEAAQAEARALRDSLARCTADLEESQRHSVVLSEEIETGREMEKEWKADIGKLEEELRALKAKVAIGRDDAEAKDKEMEAERQALKDLVAVGENVSLHVCL